MDTDPPYLGYTRCIRYCLDDGGSECFARGLVFVTSGTGDAAHAAVSVERYVVALEVKADHLRAFFEFRPARERIQNGSSV